MKQTSNNRFTTILRISVVIDCQFNEQRPYFNLELILISAMCCESLFTVTEITIKKLYSPINIVI